MKHEPITPQQPIEFHAPISEEIWDKKYRFQDPDGTIHDNTVEDTWRRIAKALAQAEGDNVRALYEEKFFEALWGWKYLTAGRITAGAGTARDVTLFNCFVMGTIPDSLAGIFDMLKEAALTMQAGGGIGYDFSTIRPKGEIVKGVGSDASGPLSFMDVWDSGWMLCTRSKQPLASQMEDAKPRGVRDGVGAAGGVALVEQPADMKFGGVCGSASHLGSDSISVQLARLD